MRTMFKKAVALALAAAMMIPVSGISAKAETVTKQLELTDNLIIRAAAKRLNAGAATDDAGNTVYTVTDEAPEAKACYYISYGKEDDSVVFYAECNFPAGITDGCVILDPNVVGADGNKINMTNSDNKNPSGGNQFKVTLGGASSFDAANFSQSRIKFEGMYTNAEGNSVNAWGGMNYWFIGRTDSNGNNIVLGDSATVTSGFSATTF